MEKISTVNTSERITSHIKKFYSCTNYLVLYDSKNKDFVVVFCFNGFLRTHAV